MVIPTFQRPGLLLRAIRSVLNQTLSDMEVLVVADGPDPETIQRVESIGDPRVRTLALPQRSGAAAARNAGAEHARSDWVAFLDDDDEWFPRKLELQMQTAHECACPFPIIACRLIARSEAGDLVWPLRTPVEDEPISEYLFCQTGLRGGEGLILPSAILTRKDLLSRVPFNTMLQRHNDVDWLLRATAVEGAQVRFVSDVEPLVVWNIERNRPRISNSSDWRYSLEWIRENRARVTAHACASFVLIWVSSTAAWGRHWKAFWLLPWKAFSMGSPRAVDLAAHLTIWLIPRRLRSSLSVMATKRRRGRSGREHAG